LEFSNGEEDFAFVFLVNLSSVCVLLAEMSNPLSLVICPAFALSRFSPFPISSLVRLCEVSFLHFLFQIWSNMADLLLVDLRLVVTIFDLVLWVSKKIGNLVSDLELV